MKTIYMDGVHDDTEALQAFINGEKVQTVDGKIFGGLALSPKGEQIKRLRAHEARWPVAEKSTTKTLPCAVYAIGHAIVSHSGQVELNFVGHDVTFFMSPANAKMLGEAVLSVARFAEANSSPPSGEA